MKTSLLTFLTAALLATAAKAQTLLPGTGLSDLPLLSTAQTRMVSPENPTGEKGKGAMAVPNANDPKLPFSKAAEDLGQGWKVNPFIKIPAHQTIDIMDVTGPGIIQHIWMVVDPSGKADDLRGAVLRFYWDGESTPSIEVPVPDFFAVGHARIAPVNSQAVIVNKTSGLNCYWPMPFRKHAKLTLTNDTDHEFRLVTYQITYALAPVPADAGYFHAQWRRAVTDRAHPDYTILDGVKGQGRYVGTFLAWTQMSDGWWGEGEVKFYLDDDEEFPTLAGTGTEDYFGASYGFPERFSTAYVGNPYRSEPKEAEYGSGGPTKWSLYRWHIMDPINFQKDIKVTIQALGWWPNGKFQPLADDIASVAFWYQREPHAAFPKFPPLAERWPR